MVYASRLRRRCRLARVSPPPASTFRAAYLAPPGTHFLHSPIWKSFRSRKSRHVRPSITRDGFPSEARQVPRARARLRFRNRADSRTISRGTRSDFEVAIDLSRRGQGSVASRAPSKSRKADTRPPVSGAHRSLFAASHAAIVRPLFPQLWHVFRLPILRRGRIRR